MDDKPNKKRKRMAERRKGDEWKVCCLMAYNGA